MESGLRRVEVKFLEPIHDLFEGPPPPPEIDKLGYAVGTPTVITRTPSGQPLNDSGSDSDNYDDGEDAPSTLPLGMNSASVGVRKRKGTRQEGPGWRDGPGPTTRGTRRIKLDLPAALKATTFKGAGEATPAKVKMHTKRVCKLLSLLYPGRHVDGKEVGLLVAEAYRSADDEYGEAEAKEWGGDFQFPSGIWRRDSQGLLRLGGDLSAYTREVHAKMAADGRLSEERIDASYMAAGLDPVGDPDYGRLKGLVGGIPIVTEEGWTPNSETVGPPPLRQKYIKLSSCVNKLMLELYDKGFIFMVPTSQAMGISGIHFSQTHWAVKKGKIWGRPIGDASADDGGSFPLNSDRVKELVDERWGGIEHPTLNSLCEMVQRHVDRHGWEDAVMWKMDLKGAFMLLFIDPTTMEFHSR